MVDEPDAFLLGAIFELEYVGGVGHDRCRSVLHEDHLADILGASQIVQGLVLSVIEAEVLGNAEELDVGTGLHVLDHVLLEATLDMARIGTTGLESPEPIRVTQVTLVDDLRRDATCALHEC